MNQTDNSCGIIFSCQQLECETTQKNRQDHQIARGTVKARITPLSRNPMGLQSFYWKTGWRRARLCGRFQGLSGSISIDLGDLGWEETMGFVGTWVFVEGFSFSASACSSTRWKW